MYKRLVSIVIISLLVINQALAEDVKSSVEVKNENSNKKELNMISLVVNDVPEVDLKVAEKLFGESDLSGLSIKNSNDETDLLKNGTLSVIEHSKSISQDEIPMKLIVLAKVQENKSHNDIVNFKNKERPYIEKYKGKVTHSVLLDPVKTGWDLIEIVEFKNKETFFNMMGDPAYTPDGEISQLSGKIFTPKTSVFIAQ